MELNYALVGARLREIRLGRGYTQEQLSELSNFSSQHISHIESGTTKLSLPCLINVCNALKITPNEVLMDSVDMAKPNLLGDVDRVFSDCSSTEIFLMLQTANSLKQALRIKNFERKN